MPQHDPTLDQARKDGAHDNQLEHLNREMGEMKRLIAGENGLLTQMAVMRAELKTERESTRFNWTLLCSFVSMCGTLFAIWKVLSK